MTVDVSSKALNFASQVSKDASQMMDALRHIVALGRQADAAGVNLAGMTFENTALKHTNGDEIQAVFTTAGAVLSWMETNFHDDAFEKVRS